MKLCCFLKCFDSKKRKGGGCRLFTILKEHRHNGKQIFILAKNELVKTYLGSLLGPVWAILKPLVTLFIFWFAFDIGIRNNGIITGPNGMKYASFIFMLPGFIAWFYINDIVMNGARSIRRNSQFVTKISFPVSTIMTFTSLSKLFVHLVLVVLMYIFLLCSGYGPSIYNIQFLYYCPMMFLFFLVLSWSTAPMSAFSKDFENLVNTIMGAAFWMSGIVYSSYSMPHPILNKLMLLNPINYFVNGYRKAFIYDMWFFVDYKETIVFLIELLALILLGAFNYNRLRKKLPDVL